VPSRSAQRRFLQSGPVCVHTFVRQRSYIERGRFAALQLFQPHWLGDRFYQYKGDRSINTKVIVSIN
jgi:hypothetical protein